jgi:hypothetical protein
VQQMQRFQLAVWPDSGRPWRNVDRWPNAQARARVTEVFKRGSVRFVGYRVSVALFGEPRSVGKPPEERCAIGHAGPPGAAS